MSKQESDKPTSHSPTSEYLINTKNIRITYRVASFLLLGLFLLWVAWALFLNQWLGNANIGSLLAKNNFTSQYWVYIQPDNANSKNYRVKGDISRVDGTYSLLKIYWDNGGYLTFDDCNLYGNDGVYKSEDSCQSSNWLNDDDGYEYYSVRIDQKVLPQQRVN